jgi:hypothetical protein
MRQAYMFVVQDRLILNYYDDVYTRRFVLQDFRTNLENYVELIEETIVIYRL